VTSSDAPPPPGGPLREDAPEGGLSPDEQRDELPSGDSEHGSDDHPQLPPVSGEPTQPEDDADLQEENAETSLDQPSS
jgi:hypothetical protein